MAQFLRQDICNIAQLLTQSRTTNTIRHSHRILAIRDLLLGDLRKNVCQRYGISRENLRHWVSWYNEFGVDGLKDDARCGRPKKIGNEKILSFKERIAKQPDPQKDTISRWRAVDIKKILEEEFGAEYTSLFGVRKLCKSLGFSFITSRPKHPKQEDEIIASFKKTSRIASRNPAKTSRQKN